MDSKKCNKIRDIVRLQQILKKWKKLANSNSSNNNNNDNNNINNNNNNNSISSSSSSSSNNGSTNKGIKFLRRTLSFTDVSSCTDNNNNIVPKGFLAVCVGKELKRFIIPTDYLTHPAFQALLREAEEEFGFQQEGVLKIPCHVSTFEKILKAVQHKKQHHHHHHALLLHHDQDVIASCDVTTTPTHHAQIQTCT